jgi:hypothetical protein
LQARAGCLPRLDAGVRVRRRLERPFGSVRWRAETPVIDQDRISVNAPEAASRAMRTLYEASAVCGVRILAPPDETSTTLHAS